MKKFFAFILEFQRHRRESCDITRTCCCCRNCAKFLTDVFYFRPLIRPVLSLEIREQTKETKTRPRPANLPVPWRRRVGLLRALGFFFCSGKLSACLFFFAQFLHPNYFHFTFFLLQKYYCAAPFTLPSLAHTHAQFSKLLPKAKTTKTRIKLPNSRS